MVLEILNLDPIRGGRKMRPPPNTTAMTTKKGITKIPDHLIINKIIILRDQKVMIDKDLAQLYGVTTKRLNEQVKRNLKRFPIDFMFQVTHEEKEYIVSQFKHLEKLKFSSAIPYVFTEHGAVMLASVLNSDRAIEVNIQIIRVFNQIRQALLDNTELRMEIQNIKKKVDNQNKNIEIVFKHLDEMVEKRENIKPRKQIGYKSTTKNKKLK